jgi:D-alanyl-D-alanine carboxypeptidase
LVLLPFPPNFNSHEVVQEAKENSRNGPSPIGPQTADREGEARELLGHLCYPSEAQMMKKIFIPVAAAILIMTSLARATAQESLAGFDDQTVRALTAIAATGRTATATPGLVVGIWVPGKGKFVRAFGTGDLSTNAPLRLDDHFRIASNTKTFTATAVLQLVDKGNLRLQDDLEKFIPGIPNGNQITIKELLNMSAGVYDFTSDEELVKKFVDDPLLPGWTPQDVIPVIQSHKPAFPPGTAVAYSDSNYVLLGLIVEKVTGRKLGDVIQTEILDKLGMRETSYPTTPDLPAPFSRGYYPITDAAPREITEINPDFPAGAGAMISTFGDTLLPPKQKEELFSLVSTRSGQPIAAVSADDPQGFSMGIDQVWATFLVSPMVWTYTGQTFGYTVQWFHRPGDKLVFVIASNSVSNTAANIDIRPLYETVFAILEPQSVADPNVAPPPSLSQHDLAP